MNVLMCENCNKKRATSIGVCEVCNGEMTETEWWEREDYRLEEAESRKEWNLANGGN